MRRKMRKLKSIKVRRYATRLIDLNGFFGLFPGATLSDIIDITKLVLFY